MAKKKISPRWILASSSPRRIGLLKTVGIEAEAHSPDVDETLVPRELPAAMVKRLSREKAHAIASQWKPSAETRVFIAADTTVVAPDQKTILGKPTTEKEAHSMLRWLSGREHLVLTGYTVIIQRPKKGARVLTRVVRTHVKMRRLSDAQIRTYVKSGEPMDKAGSYGAQGSGMGFIESIRGSYANVVGLPISQLLVDLEAEGLWP